MPRCYDKRRNGKRRDAKSRHAKSRHGKSRHGKSRHATSRSAPVYNLSARALFASPASVVQVAKPQLDSGL